MLAVLTILLMAAVAYALMREGILIAATTRRSCCSSRWPTS